MKEKILQALKTKYSNKGFKATTLDRIATILATTVTDEAKIDEAITAYEPVIEVMQSEIDSRVTDAVNKAKKEAEGKKGQVNEGGEGEGKKTETPASTNPEMAAMAKALEALTSKLNSMESGNIHKSIAETVKAKLTEKKIPEQYFNLAMSGKQFTSQEEADGFVANIESNWGAFSKDYVPQGELGAVKPIFGKTNPDGISDTTKAYLAAKADTKGVANDGLGGKQI